MGSGIRKGESPAAGQDRPAAPAPPPDPAEERVLEQELDALMVIGDLVGRIAHGVNNPLAGIRNSFLLVKGAIPPSHPHFRYVAAIEREIQRIAGLTRQLTDTYRAEADAAVGMPVGVIMTEAIRNAAAAAGADPTRIDASLRGLEVPFAAPAGLLRHGVQQLFEAAFRAAAHESRLAVEAAVDDGFSLSIVVAASGFSAGTSLRHARRLFSSLGGGVTTRAAGGTVTIIARAAIGLAAGCSGRNEATIGEDRR